MRFVLSLTIPAFFMGQSPAQNPVSAAAFEGMIKPWNGKPEQGFVLEWREASPGGRSWRIIQLRKDTRIMYSDKQAAKPADLKVGQFVSVRAKPVDPSEREKAEADVIVIEKAARQIVEVKDANAIARQVDFAREYLLLSRIDGVADDFLGFTVARGKAGPLVHFTFYPGSAKGPDGHILTSIFAIAKDARVTGYADGKKITSVEELAKALRDAK